MTKLAFLPRTFIARTRWGTAFFYDRRLGLLAQDEASGQWRCVSLDQLRRGYPEPFMQWLRFAALLPADERIVQSPSSRPPEGPGVGAA